MAEALLTGRRVLVVEDEYMVAYDLADAIGDAGAEVLGPVPSVRQGLEMIAAEAVIHAAVLDVNLGGETVYPIADALSARGVPFLFTTGYDAPRLAENYRATVRCEKPFETRDVIAALHRIIGG